MSAVHLISTNEVAAAKRGYSGCVAVCGQEVSPAPVPVDDPSYCEDCVAAAVRWNTEAKEPR